MPESKESIRARLKAARCGMPAETVRRFSRTITSRVSDIVDWSKVSSLHAYDPIPGHCEVDTRPLLLMIWQQHPHILTATWPQARTKDIAASQWLTADGRRQPVAADNRFDLIIVPLLGFNADCHRIGFGGGFYDKFLSAQPGALTIGLGYESGRTDFKPEAHDIALDYIVTERSVYCKLRRSTGAKSSRITRLAS